MADGADVKQRFEISVPTPSVRLNMGEPIKENGKPVYGYIDMSLQSDVDHFNDVNKNTFQQATDVTHQAGGHWFQYSDGPMVISTLASQNLASSEQLMLVAGAGYGNETTLDHGKRVRAHKYNNLEKHYRIEEIQNGLFEFFYGRRGRGSTKRLYDSGSFNTKSRQDALEADGLCGFRDIVYESEKELGFTGYADNWLEAISSKRAAGREWDEANSEWGEWHAGGNVKRLQYGFSPYFKRFDPYDITDPHEDPGLDEFGKFLIRAGNVGAEYRRIVDATRKLGAAATDNWLIGRAMKLADAAASFGAALAAMERIWQRHMFQEQAVPWVDEFNSGWAARTGAVKGRSESWETARKAKIFSNAAPFALANGDKMKITAPTRGATAAETTAIVATKAEVTGSSPVLTGWSADQVLTVTYESGVSKDITIATAKTTTAEDILAELNKSLLGPATLAQGVLTIASTHEGSRSHVTLSGSALGYLGFGSGSLPTSTSGSSIDAAGTPRTPITAGALTIASDSASITIDFSLTPATDKAVLITIVNAAWAAFNPPGTPSVVGDRAGKLSFECPGHYLRVSASDRALFESLGLGQSGDTATVESGPPTPANNVADASAVTLAELQALMPTLTKATISTDGGTLVIESDEGGDGKFVSGAEANNAITNKPGTMASAVGLAWSDDVTGFEGFASDYQYVNHELQKMPEDTRNIIFRPLAQAMEDAEAVVTELGNTASSAIEAFAKDDLILGPPAALGLFGHEGISIGTPDRVIGAAGRGMVFVCDGGTGQRDRKKFALSGKLLEVEKLVTFALEANPIPSVKRAEPSDENLGFRVCSDTTVNLTALTTAELLALGRGTVDNEIRGIGVARVAGSRSAEVCGFEKVSIAARSKAEDPVPAGGRVELIADTIAIGAGDEEARLLMGIKDLGSVWERKNIEGQVDELDLDGRDVVSEAYPITRKVTVESSENTTLQVGKCQLRLLKTDAEEGLYFGWDVDPEKEAAKKKPLEDEVERLENEIASKEKRLASVEKRITKLEGEKATRKAANKKFRKALELSTKQDEATHLEERIDELKTALTDAEKLVADFPENDDALVPILEVTYEAIVLGFRKAKDGAAEDGPHLKITSKGFFLETGAAGDEVSIATDEDGAKLIVNAETEWATAKDVSVTPDGKLNLEPKGDVSLKAGNVTIKPGSGTVQIG